MGRLQNLGNAVLRRSPADNKQIPQQNLLSKDDLNATVTLVNNNQQLASPPSSSSSSESRPKLRALANAGRNSLRFVTRRRASTTDVPIGTHKEQVDAKTTLIALHDACSKKKIDVQVIQYLVAKHPDGARAKMDGQLPLHTACMHHPTAAVISFLLDAYPEGTGERNKRYKLPIHVALECGASLEVIKLLVSKDPESLQVADYEITSVSFEKVWVVHKATFCMEARAGLPLHTACKYLANIHVIHYLITEYPDAARTKNKDGWLPVHFSCARGATLQTIQYLMTACPSSLYERTNHYYEYPMHLAAGRIDANLNVVKYLQSRHTIAVTQTKPNEGLYLTYYDEACMQGASPIVTWFLADVCAKAAKGYAYVSMAEDPYN